MQPQQQKNILSEFLTHPLKIWHINLTESQETGKCLPHEFSKEIKKLLLAANIHTKVINSIKSTLAGKSFWDGISFIHTPQNMTDLASKLGIAIERTTHFCYVRDHFLFLPDQSIATAYYAPFLDEATIRTHSSNLYLNRTAATYTSNQFFNVWSGYTKSYEARIYKEQEKFLKKPVRNLSYSYLEGGNVFILKNPQNRVKALIGVDHLMQTFHILELEKRPWHELAKIADPNKSFNELQSDIQASLSKEQTKKVAEEMFAQGLVHIKGKTGLISPQNQLEMMMMKFYAQELLTNVHDMREIIYNFAVSKGTLVPFEFNDQEFKKYKSMAAEYLAKLKITQGLMARDLGLASQDVHFLTQINYHLDLYMTPGPHHSMFLVNFAMIEDLLSSIEKAASSLELSEIDKQHLERYKETAKKMEHELGGLLNQVKAQLEEAGLIVIPTPGIFMYESKTMYREFPMPSGGFNINFMNALTGKSSLSGNFYFITHGAQVGHSLGNVLMDAFTLFLNQYVPQIEVHFIGKDPQNPKDFSEAMDWWNRLETQSGIHCTTFELETT